MPKAKTRKKPKYEPVLKLPPLSHEELTALRDNIAVNGVLVPILVDGDEPVRRIIDGNYRKPEASCCTTTRSISCWQMGVRLRRNRGPKESA